MIRKSIPWVCWAVAIAMLYFTSTVVKLFSRAYMMVPLNADGTFGKPEWVVTKPFDVPSWLMPSWVLTVVSLLIIGLVVYIRQAIRRAARKRGAAPDAPGSPPEH